ncbi:MULTISPECIES: copper-containing nitrite reductase [Afifella]|uniref:copper-containing nitrite reductase n=1 Tax=Afifella TaxID=643217 RepID=UPI000FE2B29C|nr:MULTISPECIES: copper-containing nitrite reductase [Afifella]MCT8268304.1 copper-containing nitrite reductase [Afifella sp. JA880]
MITRRSALMGAASAATAAFLASAPARATEKASDGLAPATKVGDLPRVKGKLVTPPHVMAHDQVAKGGPKIVEFKMTVQEKKVVVDDQGTEFQAMTYEGSMPGPTMVVHEGDYLELTLVNPETNTMPHNIDFHASTGALGGGGLTLINPGEQTVLRFKAFRPGVFIYHCAPTGMVPWHVVSGMSGAVLVLPRDGLKDGEGKPLHYDRIYTIGEFDLYIPRDEDGNYKTYDGPGESYSDTLDVMRGLIPTHVVFNGKVGALTGENAMTAKVGETVLFIHSCANRDSRPHLIGGHGDWVWENGKFANAPQKDQETWFVRGGSAAAAVYTFRQPGIYAYVNHNLIEAAELGATGHVKVEGDWDNDLMTQVSAPGPIQA